MDILDRNHFPDKAKNNLKTAIIFSIGILVMEIFGGLWTNSLALVSDAGHVFMDVIALTLAFTAAALSARSVTDTRTFGLHRIEVFAAFFNGLLLLVIAVVIFFIGVNRIIVPKTIMAPQMLVVAVIGLIVNIIVAYWLYPHSLSDMNIKGAYLHAFSDALSSLAVIASGVLSWAFGWWRADSLASLVVGGIIAFGAIRLLRESVHILLEGVPLRISLSQVENSIKHVAGVKGVSDLHIWSICSHISSLSLHVVLDKDHGAFTKHADIIQKINKLLKDEFNIEHTTIQLDYTQ